MRQMSEEELKKTLKSWNPFDENLDPDSEDDNFDDYDEDEFQELDFDHFD